MSNQKPNSLVKLVHCIETHKSLLAALIVGAFVWGLVFGVAAYDFTADGERPFRAVWNGWGTYSWYGINITVEFEGWADHDYFYHSWADQFLKGYMPYTEDFDKQIINGVQYNIPFFFPPLYMYLCVVGKLLQVNLGIGFLICLFGYLTALPIYGIVEYLSKNRNVAAIAAGSYLLNPIILYHTVYEWLNPAPFVFFAMLSFYLLMKGHRTSGLLAMATSALFKQTAFFFILPLIAFFIKRPPGTASDEEDEEEAASPENNSKITRPASDNVDLQSFGKAIAIVITYAGIWSIPYVFYDIQNYAYYVFQRMGATFLERVDILPPGNWPITFGVVFIYFGTPEWLSNAVNIGTYYNILLLAGMLPLFALMLLEVKNDNNLQGYWRKILWLTMLVMLWITIFNARGSYKYYYVLLIPFFCIFSSSRMIHTEDEIVPFTHHMIWVPAVLSFFILVPSRYVYPLFVFLILLGFVLAPRVRRWMNNKTRKSVDESVQHPIESDNALLIQQ